MSRFHRIHFDFVHTVTKSVVKSLPRVDSLGSRQFLMSLRTDLCRVPSALRRLEAPPLDAPRRRVRALDVGAGQCLGIVAYTHQLVLLI